jgi:hypothetical protein
MVGCVAALSILFGACEFEHPLSVEPVAGSEELDEGAEDDVEDTPAGWSVFVYMNADNDLEGAAIDDLNELEHGLAQVSAAPEVYVLLDRAVGHHSLLGNWTDTRLYRVVADPQTGNRELVSERLDLAELGLSADSEIELNMGDPAVLEAFLGFAAENPASHRLLILWGHTTGFRAGASWTLAPGARVASERALGIDEGSGGTSLSIASIGRVLSRYPVDVLLFDAGFMAGIEYAFELADGASVMVASQSQVPTEGWDYSGLVGAVAGAMPRAVGRTTASTGRAIAYGPEGLGRALVAAFAEDHAGRDGATVSALSLAAVGMVAERLNQVSDRLQEEVSTDEARNALREALFYNVEDFFSVPGDLNIDLGDLAAVVAGELPSISPLSNSLSQSVSQAVVAVWAAAGANERATGLSVHLIPLGPDGSASSTHDRLYFRNGLADEPLRFVQSSSWVPEWPSGPGLLYRLWYEVLP